MSSVATYLVYVPGLHFSPVTIALLQSFQEVAVHLPFPSQVVELVLEYLYSDSIDVIQSAFTASVMVSRSLTGEPVFNDPQSLAPSFTFALTDAVCVSVSPVCLTSRC